MISDLKYALRLLVKSPAFAVIAVWTLALGIGANTAIFSVVEGTLLRPLPFPNADRLVRVYEASNENGARGGSMNLSEQTVRQWGEHGGEIFEGLAAATGINVTVGSVGSNPARSVQAAQVTSNFFSVLGLPPVLGRNIGDCTYTVSIPRTFGLVFRDEVIRHIPLITPTLSRSVPGWVVAGTAANR